MQSIFYILDLKTSEKWLNKEVNEHLLPWKGLSHEMDLAFDEMHGNL